MNRFRKIAITILILICPVIIGAASLEITVENNLLFFIEIVGGTALFLFGIKTIDDGLKNLAGNKLRKIIVFVTKNKWLSIFIGVLITFMLQSGAAAVFMLIGFANASIINLEQSIGLILGAGIGNTLFVQIFSFNILKYSAFILTIGFFILFISKQKRFISIGRIIFGLGLAFFGMKVISQNAGQLIHFDKYEEMLQLLIHKPLYGAVFAAVLTTLLHSSSAIIGVFLALSFNNPSQYLFRASLPIVIGANIGSSLVVFMYGIQQYKAESRRVAVANLLIKIIGALMFMPIIPEMESLILYISSNIAHSIANFHTLFNVLLSLIILPFINPLKKILNYIIPAENESYKEEQPHFLNDSVLETPDVAIGQAFRESMRMSEYTLQMLQDEHTVFETDNEDLMDQIIKKDDIIDNLQGYIISYLTRISSETLTQEQTHQEIVLVSIVNELENIGDIVVNNLMHIARKKIKSGFQFSEEGKKELKAMHNYVLNSFEMVLDAMATGNQKLTKEIIQRKNEIIQMDNSFRIKHFKRLQEGLHETIETSSVHLDYLGNMVRINHIIVNMAYNLM